MNTTEQNEKRREKGGGEKTLLPCDAISAQLTPLSVANRPTPLSQLAEVKSKCAHNRLTHARFFNLKKDADKRIKFFADCNFLADLMQFF